MPTIEDLKTSYKPNWCPGCGNINIWSAFQKAAVNEGWDNTNSVLVAGVGCHGHIVNFTKITSFEGLHGRALPVATGIKMANPNLNVFVHTGDGDCLAEGGNHFLHTCRRNHNLTILLHDNGLYALTTGQTCPTSPKGFKSKSTPQGNTDEPILPAYLAIAAGATFVARAYSGDMPKLTEMIIAANKHQGTSFIDILQPCFTFNKVCTHSFYHENIYYLGIEHNPSDKQQALIKASEFGLKSIPLGILYQIEKPSYESQMVPPKHEDINELFKKFI